jgi:hypothetical protein
MAPLGHLRWGLIPPPPRPAIPSDKSTLGPESASITLNVTKLQIFKFCHKMLNIPLFAVLRKMRKNVEILMAY